MHQSDSESAQPKRSHYETNASMPYFTYSYAEVLTDYKSDIILIFTNGICSQRYTYVPAKFSLLFLSHKISEQIFKCNIFYMNTL